MRRLLTSIALLALASLLASAASASTGQRPATKSRLAAATATFQDATGEDASAPDVTSVTVSSDDAGALSLQVAIPNRPTLAPDMALMAAFDSDNNASSGNSELLGADYLIEVDPTADATSATVFHWDGAEFAHPKAYPSAVQYANGLVTIAINRSELGGTGKCSFMVAALSNIDFATDNWDNVYEDDAPNSGVYAFDTGLAPIEQPAATKLVVTAFAMLPAKPAAGKTILAAVALETDTGMVPEGGTMTCKAQAGTKALRVATHAILDGKAMCGWKLPKTSKDKMLHGSITVKAGGLAATKGFSARIR